MTSFIALKTQTLNHFAPSSQGKFKKKKKNCPGKVISFIYIKYFLQIVSDFPGYLDKVP